MKLSFELKTIAINIINKSSPHLAASEANKNNKWENFLNDLRKLPEYRIAFEKCGVILIFSLSILKNKKIYISLAESN